MRDLDEGRKDKKVGSNGKQKGKKPSGSSDPENYLDSVRYSDEKN